MIGFIVCFNPS